jgi:D-alanyl-lipoteichoic acid acyltransferase DltB (MBOAT superfamily)
MSFINTEFFIFLAVSAIVYYLMYLIKPVRKFQWIWLLIVSYYYYLSFGTDILFFILFTTVSTYVGALFIEKFDKAGKDKLAAEKATLTKEEKKAIKNAVKTKKRIVTAIMLVANFGVLGLIKYLNFFIENINSVMKFAGSSSSIALVNLVLPIGISFYTFQSMGYIIDVYQGKYEAEKNPFKLALFVSFFPQIMQGPIGRFNRLAVQLYESHSFDLRNVERGLQLIFWGICKKMIIADRVSVFVNTIFTEYYRFCGFFNIVAIIVYTIQLYADFSGGMDIVMGAAEIFGISLDQNFKQPFFSKSIGEFWRRWHITLGTWMKDYVFYPFSLSKGMNKFSKFLKKHCNAHIAKTLPICIADILIFLIVGIWHGAAWKYIAYGLYNGIIIAFSAIMEPVYDRTKKFLHINGSSAGWKLFQIIRTSALVVISNFFDIAVDFSAAITMMKDIVYQINIGQLTDGTMFGMGMKPKDFIIVGVACLIWLIVSIIKEKGIDVRDAIERRPLVVRWAIYLIMVFSIPVFGYIGETTGFIYAQF